MCYSVQCDIFEILLDSIHEKMMDNIELYLHKITCLCYARKRCSNRVKGIKSCLSYTQIDHSSRQSPEQHSESTVQGST